jgi:dihydroxyacetone kinase-like protein
MTMKKFINRPEDFVTQSLEGMAAAYAGWIVVHLDPTFVCRADAPVQGKVALISGGGSGHEPMHAGFVGPGMLDAACPGQVFTSPTPDQMLEAARAVHGGAGVLNIVKNYSGDVMNFEMAAELAHAEGIGIANILIDDDAAVKDSLYTQGRRGVGTTVLAEKICGAAAERGYALDHLAALCRRVNLGGRSMGVALSSCTVPAKGSPTFALGENEMEFGIGIHGEPGRQRMDLRTADEIAEMLATSILDDPAYSRITREWDAARGTWSEVEHVSPPLQKGDPLLAFVNGMGGTPLAELYVLYRKLVEVCSTRGLSIQRNLIGSFMTSLEMQGASITLLRLDSEMIDLWDAPVHTPGLRWGA